MTLPRGGPNRCMGGHVKVFVTGSTGLFGSNLVRALLAEGHGVVGLTRTKEKAEKLLGDTDATFVQGDMQEIAGFARALEGCDAIVHAAAYFREYDGGSEHADALEAINIQGTLELMSEADRRGIPIFVHISSGGTVGIKPDGTPGDEDTPPLREQLENLYFRSKHEGDRKIAAFEPASGMKVIEILPGWMWGPGDAAPTGAGRFCLDFIAGRIPVVPDGGAAIVDARDVAQGTIRAIERGQHGDRFILAGTYHSLKECLETLATVTGKRAPRLQVPGFIALAFAHLSELFARLTGGRPSVPVFGLKIMLLKHDLSSDRAKQRLGAEFRPFEETARDVVEWYRRHGPTFGLEDAPKLS